MEKLCLFEKLSELGYEYLQNQTYSTDQASTDYLLFGHQERFSDKKILKDEEETEIGNRKKINRDYNYDYFQKSNRDYFNDYD